MTLCNRAGILVCLQDIEHAILDLKAALMLAVAIEGDSQFAGKLRVRLRKANNVQAKLSNAQNEQGRVDAWANFYQKLARTLLSKDDYVGVIRVLNCLLDIDTDHRYRATLLYGIGNGYFRLGLFDLAVEYYMSALQCGNTSAALRGELGHALSEIGKPLEVTKEHFEVAIEKPYSRVAWAYSWYALALSSAGQHPLAEMMASRALSSDPRYKDHPALLTNFARVLIATHDPHKRAEAVNYLERAKQVAKPGFEMPSRMLDELRKEDDGKGNGIL